MKMILKFSSIALVCGLITASCKKEINSDKEVASQQAPQSVASNEDILQLLKKEADASNPNWKAISLTPVPFKPIEMADKNGRPIPPDEVITLSNGRKMTAAEYFKEINEIEQKLNSRGYSLRNNQEVVASEMVNNEKQSDSEPVAELEEDNGQPEGMKTTDPKLLKTISSSFSKDWSYGSSATFKATLAGKITAKAKIYKYIPGDNRSLTEFRAIAKSSLNAVIAGGTLELFNANGDFYAPADVSKNMMAKLTVTAGTTTLLNLNESYLQNKTINGTIGTTIRKEVPFEVPIISGVGFTGKLGVKGRADLQYGATLNRKLSGVRAKPIVDLSGYAEGSINYGLVDGGITGNITFVKGFLDLKDSIGIFSQNSSRIVVRNGYYFGYDLKMVKGKIKVYANVCTLPYVPCLPYSNTIYDEDGYVKAGTLYQGNQEYSITNN